MLGCDAVGQWATCAPGFWGACAPGNSRKGLDSSSPGSTCSASPAHRDALLGSLGNVLVSRETPTFPTYLDMPWGSWKHISKWEKPGRHSQCMWGLILPKSSQGAQDQAPSSPQTCLGWLETVGRSRLPKLSHYHKVNIHPLLCSGTNWYHFCHGHYLCCEKGLWTSVYLVFVLP